MTGFGRAVVRDAELTVTVVAQSWNHRHADFVVRLPESCRALEPKLRELAAQSILRGRLEVAIRIDRASAAAAVALDRDALEAALRAVEPLVASGAVQPQLTVGDLLRSPFVRMAAGDANAAVETPAPEEAIARATAEALAELGRARAEEGARLGAALVALVEALEGSASDLARRRAALAGEIEATLRRKLDALLPGGSSAVPPERLAQEIVLLADRSDVEEELERLRGHLVAVRGALAEPGAIGKRLDFLVQEIQRELSTLAAKARDLELVRQVVDAKVTAERLKEQIQNVE